MNALFLYCRAGFENDCAAEITAQAACHGTSGYCKAKPASGYVIFTASAGLPIDVLFQRISIKELIFCRQWFVILGLRNDLPVGDRIGPLLEIAGLSPLPLDGVMVDTTDTNEGKQLSPLCRKLTPLVLKQIEMPAGAPLGEINPLKARLHICFLSTHAAYVGYSMAANAEPWPMGVPRLKFPSHAPSRSTLKLEEAFLRFLTESERQQWLMPGMQAVDLGAAPGGWTWQLVKRQLHVIAVDNGNMQADLMESGLVEHIRADGFTYQPAHPVDWMVCDIIDRPQRVVERAALWLTSAWCKQTVFNLKLPMKQRYQHTQDCLHYLREQLEQNALTYRMACKQLYHDREEVTVFVRVSK
jgi:23S rRNA (cytidine2498-2'-O)-methyltransferase